MKKRIAMMLLMAIVTLGAWAQSVVSGTVVSADDGQPIIGASVKVQGTKTGAVTGMDGSFKITNVPASAKMLEISYIGMQTAKVAIKNNVYVQLQSEEGLMDELVVIGYGSAKKVGSIVGSVGKVNSDKVDRATTSNFTDALAGQVAGLTVLSANGDPSKSATIRLRGISTINASSTPLFILDGAPITSSMFSTLNPSDIETITVLKDAASTSIYGSRAANGVIVITSKRGRFDSKPVVSVKAQVGWSSKVTDNYDVMNSQQYKQYRELIGMPLTGAALQAVDEFGINTDWSKEMFKTAPVYDLNATITGGGSSVSYYLSFNHHDQEGIIEQSGLRRETIRFNLNSKVNKYFKAGLQGNFGYTQYETNAENENRSTTYITNPVFFSRFALPFDSPYYYTIGADGKPVFGDKAGRLHYSGFTTPEFANTYRDTNRRKVTLNLVAYEELTPLKGLTLRAQQALDGEDYTGVSRYLPYGEMVTPMGDKISGRSGSVSRAYERYYQYTITNTAEYKFNIGDHFASFLLGQESIIMKDDAFDAYGAGYEDSRLMGLGQAVTVSPSDISESLTERVSNSYFFNANYNYAEKYYFDGTIRRDGSSRFAPGHRWSTFFSVGGRWDMKKEKWLKDIKWLNELTIRASYGTVGNSGIGDYAYYGLIGTGSNNYNGKPTIGLSQASNNDLTWETVKNTDLGFTARFFDRLTVMFDYYNKKTVDMLMEIPYSYTTGIESGYGNVGSMVNRGIDVDLKYEILKNKDFYWAVRANFNYNKNKITELFDGRDEFAMPNYGLCYKIGHDCGEMYSVEWAGVDPRDGKQMWVDVNGNLTKEYNEERDSKLIGKSMFAPWSGGFGTDFSWKGLSLSVDFAWAADKYMTNNDRRFLEDHENGMKYNQGVVMLNTWTKPGDITDIPAVGESLHFDTHLIENASFLRMKNVTLQYSLPKSLLKNTGLEKVNFFIIGRNLLTFTSFSGYDPEPESNLVRFNYPNTRQVMLGTEITF